jgi:hypothetical protein
MGGISIVFEVGGDEVYEKDKADALEAELEAAFLAGSSIVFFVHS